MKQPLTWVSYTYAGPRVLPTSGFRYLFSSITIEDTVWMSNQVLCFYMDAISYLNHNADLVDTSWLKNPQKWAEAHTLCEPLISRNRESYGFQQLEIH